jgi:very-short-patch-repair endonuclease
MGIECDGATYHVGKSVRDRDRLRQEILESMNWEIRRIWSTDWFTNPRGALAPILEELKRIAPFSRPQPFADPPSFPITLPLPVSIEIEP